ncbi:glycosyltransferase [Egibacter rhizosphaerae]|uniref:Glycosyltransferase n=2 Tax=Egibacter rhizosphaerae TaxID=1670831 RepID=A0A411YHV1_9ACTN|nr:glycosyltransferase [Egibacter rhizosphaerae]
MRRLRAALGAAPNIVVAPRRATASAALRPAGAATDALVIALDEPGWAARLAAVTRDEGEAALAPGDRRPLLVADDARELAGLLLPARALGEAPVVTIVLGDAAPPDIGELTDPVAPVPLRELPPRVVEVAHRRRGDYRLLEVAFATVGPVGKVLAAATARHDALARGLGADGLQVAIAGESGAHWVPGDLRARLATGAWADDTYTAAGRSLDVLLVDADWLADDPARRASVLSQVRALGAAVVHLPGGGGPGAEVSRAAEPRAADGPDAEEPGEVPVEVTALPPVDLSVCNPTGFRAEDGPRPLAVATGTAAEGPRLAAAVGDDVDVTCHAPHAPVRRDLVDRVHGARAVVDHPALHDDVPARARVLAALAAAGAPLVLLDHEDPREGPLGALLGRDLLGLARSVEPGDLADPLVRERHSVRVRRAALTRHAPGPRWRELRARLGLPARAPRTISVVTSTNRPEMLAHLARQLAAQRHPHVEAVVALHGATFDEQAADHLRAEAGVPVTVLHAPPEATLGAVLDRCTDAASGRLITKMDDDDWYGPDHLVDLELAWSYGDGELVGKAAEFVHLDDIDVTIRRFTGGAESRSDRIAGGTLLLDRGDLEAAGGWRDAPRAVDRLLIDDVRATGGEVHRTHGFGFVLTRRPSGHTWDVETGYFLRQAGWQRRGLALDTADVDASPR